MNKEKTKILIVDDNPKNIQLAAVMLSGHGYLLAFDQDGKSALERIKFVKFDLILLDIVMPEMDGYEVCRRLKDDPATKDIPIIFLTAKTDTENIVKGFQLGAVDYITKPFNAEELLARVNTHIELGRHREHLEVLVQQRTEAIRIMLETREEISAGIERKITDNINIRILPLLKNVQTTPLTSAQKNYLNLIQSELSEILSEFTQKLSSGKFNLTQTEIRIAALIREDRSSKEIAELLHLSESAINFHRDKLRKKLGLNTLKTGLKSFLQSMD